MQFAVNKCLAQLAIEHGILFIKIIRPLLNVIIDNLVIIDFATDKSQMIGEPITIARSKRVDMPTSAVCNSPIIWI